MEGCNAKSNNMNCPRILKKLEKFKQLSWFYNTAWSGGDKYQVVGLEDQFVVDKNSAIVPVGNGS